MIFDLVINNGTLVDGTGRPAYKADVGLLDGRIAAISTDERLSGLEALDASGLVLAPGFIDVHSHADWILPLPDHDSILAPLVLQGITTLVAGNCGFSPAPVTEESIPHVDGISEVLRDRPFPYRWRSFGEFLDVLEGDGLLLNAAFLVGHGTLRSAVLGGRAEAPGPEEQAALNEMTRQALEGGAFGFSAGLAYAPGVFAGNEELLALLRVTAGAGAVFTVHGRAYSWVSPFYKPMFLGAAHNLRSARELIELARRAGVRLELSHLIFVGRRTWRTCRKVLDEIERAADAGMDLAFDAFPYTVGNSTINVVFPDWFLDGFAQNVQDPSALRRLKRDLDLLQIALGMTYKDIRLLVAGDAGLAHLEGLDFGEIAGRLKMSQFDAYVHVARLSRGEARILLGTYSGDERREDALRAALAHPLCSFMTDTILSSHQVHNPASFGAFPRILGRYSRDLRLFSMEEAVRRMTSLPAERIGLQDVGRIAEGFWADLVLFDPRRVADLTTPERADAPPTGIHAVLISGQLAAHNGRLVSGKRYGRVLRRTK
jgi:N-acyl-D-amino-acid deacylase